MTGRIRFCAALLAGFLSNAPAALSAEAGGCGPPGGRLAEAGGVASLGEGGTLILDDGQAVRLSGIAVPAGDGAEAAKARAALERLSLGRAVALARVGNADRYARLPADVFIGEGDDRIWLQERLVAEGLARVQSFKHNRACTLALLAREDAARKARLGMWASPDFAVRATDRPELLHPWLDSFQIVEGVVLSTGAAGRKVYLNFGRRWKTDFTGVIATGDLDAFAAAGIFPLKLPRQRVRLRGWLTEHDGPMMQLDHPEQIELIDDADRND
jgi:endonuclease YncB( thermonuclease family)